MRGEAVAVEPREFSGMYLAYCRAHGHADDPEGMLAADRETWPGGHMCGFILWVGSKRREWARYRGLRGHDYVTFVVMGEEKSFLEWVEGRASTFVKGFGRSFVETPAAEWAAYVASLPSQGVRS